MKAILALIVFFSSLNNYSQAQDSKDCSDINFEKQFIKNLKFNRETPDSLQTSAIFFFEIEINKEGGITKILCWNNLDSCTVSSMQKSLYQTNKAWLKKNKGLTVLFPVLVIYDNFNVVSHVKELLSRVDYEKLRKFPKLSGTKFMRPCELHFYKNNIQKNN